MMSTSSHTHGEGEEAVSTEENKALVRRFVDEVQSAGNTDAIDEMRSPEFVNHSTPPGVPSSREGVKQPTAMFRQAFPDSYFILEDMMAEGVHHQQREVFSEIERLRGVGTLSR